MSPQRRRGIIPYPFLRTLNVLWGKLDLSAIDKMDFTDDEVEKLSLKIGDLLVCEGGKVGRTAVWNGYMDICLHQNHIHRLRRITDNVIPEFYMYWMQAAFKVFKLYGGQASETTIPNLSIGRLRSFLVPFPPLEIQRHIAAKLQELMNDIESARNACEKQLEAAKALPSAYLREVFESPEAKKWEKMHLGDVCKIFSGSPAPQNKRYFQNGEHPFVRVQDLAKYKRTTELVETNDCINDDAIKELQLVKAKKGTILFPKSGAAIRTNNRAILGLDAFIVSHLAAISPRPEFADTYFVYYWLCLADMVHLMENPGYPSLKLSTVSKTSIPLPPVSTQRRVASQLKEKMNYIDRLESLIQDQQSALGVLYETILKKAFRGEL